MASRSFQPEEYPVRCQQKQPDSKNETELLALNNPEKIAKNMLEVRRVIAPTVHVACSFSQSGKVCRDVARKFAMMRLWCVCTSQRETTSSLHQQAKIFSPSPSRQDTCQMRRSSEEQSIHSVKSSRSRKTNLLRQMSSTLVGARSTAEPCGVHRVPKPFARDLVPNPRTQSRVQVAIFFLVSGHWYHCWGPASPGLQ